MIPLPRARPHQLGEAMPVRGPGEGPNLIALAATPHRCALRTQFQSENERRPEATHVPLRVAGTGRDFFTAPKDGPTIVHAYRAQPRSSTAAPERFSAVVPEVWYSRAARSHQ